MAAPRLSPDEVLAFKTSIALNESEDDRLGKIAKSQNRSKSYILRTAFNFYLLSYEEQAQR
jgi:predicted transcriptional regulator